MLWLHGVPAEDARTAFYDRGFELSARWLETDHGIDGVRAALLVQEQKTSVTDFADLIRTNAARFLDEGCLFVIRPEEKGRRSSVNVLSALRVPVGGLDRAERISLGISEAEPPMPHIHLFSPASSWASVANFVASYDPGRARNRDLIIDGCCSNEAKSLLERAFSDCRRVSLRDMDEAGRSGAGVFRAYADLNEGVLGPWPQPFFVKIGSREDIVREFTNYQSSVYPYLPYHLAPRLVPHRCQIGATHGILVGDFVDESEGLLDSAESGRAVAALSYLFDKTLHGWYRAAEPVATSIGALLGPLLPTSSKIQNTRLIRANEFEKVQSFEEIVAALCATGDKVTLLGPIHGDLNVGNVRVRKSEAIVLDFLSQDATGILLADLAALEASLLVDGFRRDGRLTASGTVVKWFESIESLYGGDPVNCEISDCHPADAAHWFFGCVSIIRRHARAMERGPMQYAAALSAALLSKAAKDANAVEPEASRRAAAYVFASRLAESIRRMSPLE